MLFGNNRRNANAARIVQGPREWMPIYRPLPQPRHNHTSDIPQDSSPIPPALTALPQHFSSGRTKVSTCDVSPDTGTSPAESAQLAIWLRDDHDNAVANKEVRVPLPISIDVTWIRQIQHRGNLVTVVALRPRPTPLPAPCCRWHVTDRRWYHTHIPNLVQPQVPLPPRSEFAHCPPPCPAGFLVH